MVQTATGSASYSTAEGENPTGTCAYTTPESQPSGDSDVFEPATRESWCTVRTPNSRRFTIGPSEPDRHERNRIAMTTWFAVGAGAPTVPGFTVARPSTVTMPASVVTGR